MLLEVNLYVYCLCCITFLYSKYSNDVVDNEQKQSLVHELRCFKLMVILLDRIWLHISAVKRVRHTFVCNMKCIIKCLLHDNISNILFIIVNAIHNNFWGFELTPCILQINNTFKIGM